jgi:hypothetical protein
MGDNMDETKTSSMYRRTLRTGIVVGVIGVLAMLFSNLFMQTFGVVSLNESNAFFVILTQLYLIATVACLPFSAALISAALVMRYLDTAAVRAKPSAEQQPVETDGKPQANSGDSDGARADQSWR